MLQVGSRGLLEGLLDPIMNTSPKFHLQKVLHGGIHVIIETWGPYEAICSNFHDLNRGDYIG
jgi:hypothetical protein